MNPIISNLLTCIELEEKEQARRYRLDQSHTLKQLKAEGLAIQPIRIVKKYFGYADYPELSFRIPYPQEINMFKDGVAIECFITGEEPIKGVLINLDGKSGELRLFAPDFPEWIEDDGLGIKLTPDTRTTTLMTKTLKGIEERKDLNRLFLKLHEKNIESPKIFLNESNALHFKNENLNTSQRQAVNKIVHNKDLVIVHGPPGTGKTTTLIEAIVQLVKAGNKSAESGQCHQGRPGYISPYSRRKITEQRPTKRNQRIKKTS